MVYLLLFVRNYNVIIALNRHEQLRFHFDRALDNGLKKEELIEVITHLAFYSGWPNSMSAIMVTKELFSNKDSSR
ncbi:MAG TPA: carboxymuconolactone decarboxylase family protein [Desulfomonilaceae bacterium]|nr:carboxymuconolactone decarboxylase family protein [Desulfomonilaceae bacterium]